MGDRELQLAVLRATLAGRHFLRNPPKLAADRDEGRVGAAGAAGGAAGNAAAGNTAAGGAAADGEGYPGVDADNDDLDFAVFDSDAHLDASFDDAASSTLLELSNTWEDERGLTEVPIENRINPVTAPVVVARGDGSLKFRCHSCGQSGGFSVQLPMNVFATAYRTANGVTATKCLLAMADLLVAGDFTAVYERITCCKKLPCLLGQDIMSADEYCTWIRTAQRPQLERGTDRKHQSRTFSSNLTLLRVLATRQPRVTSTEQLRALFEFLVLNSQYIQEREKRFIATAMAVVENPHLFPYLFGDRQGVVERMAQIPRNYASRVIFPHLLNSTLNDKKWISRGNRILETAFPKAADALFVILCLDNAAGNLNHEVNGRMAHRVPEGAKYASLFTPEGFEAALTKAVKASPKYDLRFASTGRDFRETASYGNTREQRAYQRMLAALESKHRTDTTSGKGAPAAFTCGSRQANSGVHPKERYVGVLKALGHDDAEVAKHLALFLDEHPTGNLIGFEKLNKTSLQSKACETVRPVELFTPDVPTVLNKARGRLGIYDATAAVAVHKRSKNSV